MSINGLARYTYEPKTPPKPAVFLAHWLPQEPAAATGLGRAVDAEKKNLIFKTVWKGETKAKNGIHRRKEINLGPKSEFLSVVRCAKNGPTSLNQAKLRQWWGNKRGSMQNIDASEEVENSRLSLKTRSVRTPFSRDENSNTQRPIKNLFVYSRGNVRKLGSRLSSPF